VMDLLHVQCMSTGANSTQLRSLQSFSYASHLGWPLLPGPHR
jgi:hypothetical protein